MKKCLLVYNPVSGGSKKFIKLLPYVSKKLQEVFDIVDIRPTKYAKEATKIAKEACGEYDSLIVSGGDGTFSEVLNGIGENKKAPTLGYIPSGSCGDIANNHNIPHNIKKATKLIVKGNKKAIDLCKLNDGYFSYVAGVGTYTSGIYKADQKLKRKIGKAAYYMSAVKETFNVQPLKVKITMGKKVVRIDNALLVLVLNTKSVGGFPYFNYKAKMDDGKFDILVVKKDTFNTPVNIWKLFLNGVEDFKDNRNISLYTCKKASILTNSLEDWNVDGDDGKYKSIEVEALKKKINMYVG